MALSIPGWTQDRCGAEAFEKLNPHNEKTEQFENWLNSKIIARAKSTGSSARTNATYQIPVVVHVIHNGTSDPTNISNEQILSQIKVLNQDYTRNNADQSNTPATFTGVAGSLDIEFVLAKRDPEGLPTTGIVRVKGPRNTWTVANNYQLKELSYWPAEEYLNIWVCNLTDYLGYAQFPESTLPGLGNSSSNSLTDGVVIAYTAFGSIDDGNFPLQDKYNKGRTATHEIGHFLGLRHIWGDDAGDCGGNGDYVTDTPDQGDRTLNCPSHPRTTCTTTAMFQNYLDYTNDACMNLFTKGQVERMVSVLENSPRRNSLLTSPALLPPASVPNDLGIRAVISPKAAECSSVVVPTIEVRNYGNNAITSAQISIKKGGTTVETKSFTLNLAPTQSTQLSFSNLTLTTGNSKYAFEVITTNGTTDGYAYNNVLIEEVLVPETAAAPLIENFEATPSNWIIQNPDLLSTWQVAAAPNDNPANRAYRMNFFDYEDSEGEIDILYSPIIDLSDATVGLLQFDVAYARYQSSNDGLRVVVLSNCDGSISSGTIVYEKSGEALATTANQSSAFTPSSSAEWRTENLNLNQFLGQSGIQLVFIGVNDWGNNLYMDKVRLYTNDFSNLALSRVNVPSAVECNTITEPKVIVKNYGSTVTSFEVNYNINGVDFTHPVDGLSFEPGAEMELVLPQTVLSQGENSIAITVTNPNGEVDADLSDNTITLANLVRQPRASIPFRENFENNFEGSWTSTNPKGNESWVASTIGSNTALVYQGFTNPVLGDKAWLVSPLIDLSSTTEASLSFEVSYGQRDDLSEQLDVLLSTSCDAPFEILLESYTASDLSTQASSAAWKPGSESDWTKQHIDLSAYAGLSDVRVAFVVTNKKGNNIYLDDIQLYLSANPPAIEFDGPFAVYPNPDLFDEAVITFNFEQSQDVTLEVVDNLGKIVSSTKYASILNQTIPIHTGPHESGLYIVRVLTGEERYFVKLLCMH